MLTHVHKFIILQVYLNLDLQFLQFDKFIFKRETLKQSLRKESNEQTLRTLPEGRTTTFFFIVFVRAIATIVDSITKPRMEDTFRIVAPEVSFGARDLGLV